MWLSVKSFRFPSWIFFSPSFTSSVTHPVFAERYRRVGSGCYGYRVNKTDNFRFPELLF